MVKKLLTKLWFRVVLGIVGFVLLLHLCLWGVLRSIPDEDLLHYRQPLVAIDSATVAGKTDSLMALCGENVQLPAEFEVQALLALSHYPELWSHRVQFTLKETFIPLESRPDLSTLFRNKEDREYQVIISTKSLDFMEPALLKNLSFDAQVGVLGHELAHAAYFRDKNLVQLVAMAWFLLVSVEYQSQFEKDTDRRTICYGLGQQLWAWAAEVRHIPGIEQKDLLWMDMFYLRPEEILSHEKGLK